MAESFEDDIKKKPEPEEGEHKSESVAVPEDVQREIQEANEAVEKFDSVINTQTATVEQNGSSTDIDDFKNQTRAVVEEKDKATTELKKTAENLDFKVGENKDSQDIDNKFKTLLEKLHFESAENIDELITIVTNIYDLFDKEKLENEKIIAEDILRSLTKHDTTNLSESHDKCNELPDGLIKETFEKVITKSELAIEKFEDQNNEFEIATNEEIKNEIDPKILENEIENVVNYLNSNNVSENEYNRLSEYIDALETRKNELKKILAGKGIEKIGEKIQKLNGTLIKVEQPTRAEEIENIKKAKTVKELSEAVDKIETKEFDGKENEFLKILKDMIGKTLNEVANIKIGKLKEDVDIEETENILTKHVTDEDAKAYITALFESIKAIEQAESSSVLNKFKVDDKVYAKGKDGTVSEGWVVAGVEGENIEVKNEKSGEILKTAAGELASWNSEDFIKMIEEKKKRIKEIKEQINIMQLQAEQNSENVSDNEDYKKLIKELEDLEGQGEQKEKKEGPKTAGDIVDNLKAMKEILEKRRQEFAKLENSEEVLKVVEKAKSGEKLSEKEQTIYKSRFFAKDELTISQVGVSAVENADLYAKDLSSLSYQERMNILDMRIKASQLHILLHTELRNSIASCNEKIDQLNPKRKGIASTIVDGILDKAKNIPIVRNLVYKKIEQKGEEEKKKEEKVKSGAIVSLTEKGQITDGWKVLKVEGENVTLEKETKVSKEINEADLMAWNGIKEEGKFKVGDKVKIIRSDKQIDTDWNIESIDGKKIKVTKEKVRIEKTVKMKDIVIKMEGLKHLATDLNNLKESDLDMSKITKSNLEESAKRLREKFLRMLKTSDYFEGMDEGSKKPYVDMLNVDTEFYSKNIKEKRERGLKKDLDDDKKQINEIAQKHKDIINTLPEKFKDFKENMIKFIDLASETYHETKYSDEEEHAEPDENITKVKDILNTNEIERIKSAKNAEDLIASIENRKIALSGEDKNKTAQTCMKILEKILDRFDRNNKTIKKAKETPEEKEFLKNKKVGSDYIKSIQEKINELSKTAKPKRKQGSSNRQKNNTRRKKK